MAGVGTPLISALNKKNINREENVSEPVKVKLCFYQNIPNNIQNAPTYNETHKSNVLAPWINGLIVKKLIVTT